MVNPSRVKPDPFIDGPLPTCLGYQQLDTATLAASVGLTVPNNATMVVLQAEGANIRYRAYGVAPTSTVGMLITAGAEVIYPASDSAIAALRFIRTTTGAILNAQFF